jgi:hypothetical protein
MNRKARDHVEHRGNHPAVQNLAPRIADQFGLHVEAQLRRIRIGRLDLQAEDAVERHSLLEHMPQFGFHRLQVSHS